MIGKTKDNTPDIIIAVMGPTGSGKSNFINKLTGNKEESGAAKLKSYTQDIEEFVVDLNGKRYLFVDTPGFDDTYRSDRDILRTIADWLEKKYRGHVKLTGIIYTHRISDNRMSGSVCKNLDLFGRLCGDEAAQRVRLVTTMWDNQRPENTETYERRVSQLEGNFWKPLIDTGARHKQFFNDQKSAWVIVNELVQKCTPLVQGGSVDTTGELGEAGAGQTLLIQEEMVDAQKKLNETSAGKALYSRFQKVLLEQKETLRQLAGALAEKDPKVAEQLRAEYNTAEAKMHRAIKDMEKMKIPLGRQIALSFGGNKTHSRKIDLNFVPGVREISPSWFTENDFVIFVVGPAGSDKSSFTEKLIKNRNFLVRQIREHVHVLRCNLNNPPPNIVVVDISSFHTDNGDSCAEDTVVKWLHSSFPKTCHSGVLFLHSLNSNSVDDNNTLMIGHLEAFVKTLPDGFTVPSRIYVVPVNKADPGEGPTQRRSRLEITSLNVSRVRKWPISMFPGVFEGQPEIAWSAALLLLKDVTEAQPNEFFPFPRPNLKRMPARLPDARLALVELSHLLLREFRDRSSNDSSALIRLVRTVLKLTPPENPRHHLVLIHLSNVLHERFKEEGKNVDLDEVIALRQNAWKCMPLDDPERQKILLELDDCLYERFKKGNAMADLEEIISLRRAALERTAPSNQCSELLDLANSLIEKYKKLGSVTDVNEAIDLGRTALESCPPGHPDHALSQSCLANYLRVKIRKRDAQARTTGAGDHLSTPSFPDIQQLIKKIVFETLENVPLRLFHTPTGALCNRDLLLSYFEDSHQYRQLLSLVSTCDSQLSAAQIRDAVIRFFQFATLSHRWGSGEPLLRDVEGKRIYDMDGGDGLEKLQQFCTLALEHGFSWAWSDTCCIDKDSSAELQEAIGTMFCWYRSSSLTLVHLCDVSDAGSLTDSVWFERGWTLQELLASHVILFYTQDWSLYKSRESANHKTDDALLEEVEGTTRITKQHLKDFRPGLDDARSRLHWASHRRTTRPEDIAYSLFGIFKVHLPIFYGESVENALGRLLAEIISGSGDVSVLDWVGEASSFNSCFPANLVPYQTVPRIELIPSDPARLDDLDFEKTRELYSKLAALPRAGFVNSKLILPSIIYQVTAVIPRGSSISPSRYTYAIHSSRLMPLEVTLSVNLDKVSGRYILARPWHPKVLPTQTSSDDDVIGELLERLKQPFNTLLLEKLPHNEYRRVPSVCMITARPQDLNSIIDSEVLIPEIV